MLKHRKIILGFIVFFCAQILALAEGPGSLSGAKIIVEQPHGAHFEATSDRLGNFKLANIPAGSYIVRVVPPSNAQIPAELKCRLMIEGFHEGKFDRTFSAEQLVKSEISTKAQIVGGSINGKISLER